MWEFNFRKDLTYADLIRCAKELVNIQVYEDECNGCGQFILLKVNG